MEQEKEVPMGWLFNAVTILELLGIIIELLPMFTLDKGISC
jgi:hypothetical protein